MAAATAAIAAISSITALSSSNALGSASSLKVSSVSCSAQRVVAVRGSLGEEQNSVTRRDVLATLLGAGAALGFVGQAMAANPGSLARQKKGEKKEVREEKSSSSAASPRFE